MKTNNVMLRPMGQFKVEQRTKDGMFNATALLKQWNEANGDEKESGKFIIEENEFNKLFSGEEGLIKEEPDGNLWLNDAQYRNFLYFLDPELSLVEFPCLLLNESLWNRLFEDIDVFPQFHTLKYFTYIATDASGLYKIGRTSNLKAREAAIRIGNHSFTIIMVICDDVENELHLQYSKKRVKGEWFSLSGSDIRSIREKYTPSILK